MKSGTSGEACLIGLPLNCAAQRLSKVTVLSVAELLARGIQSIHEETSISELFI